MSENTTTPATEKATEAGQDPQANGAGTPTEEQAEGAHLACFASLEEAKRVKPPSANWKVFVVTSPAGRVCWTWATGGNDAIRNLARTEGYVAERAEGKAGTVTKEAVAARLAAFTDEELAAMGLSRKKGKK